jgi:RNA recognition motif-containing protein
MTDAARWKATVHVGGLSQLATSTHVFDAFIPFGDIVEVQLPKADAPNSTDPHKGFAYVEFEDSADAKEAIDNMDQSEFFGKVIKVSPARAPKSADEGLGSRKAIWEQVRLFNIFLITIFFLIPYSFFDLRFYIIRMALMLMFTGELAC